MQAVLAMFRGETSLADAPIQVIEPGTDTTDVGTDAQPPTYDPDAGPDTSTEPAPATTLPNVQAEENLFGIVPDKNVSC